MASIAYITDHEMIEYHRLNGNKYINFWKPSNSKKFSEFHQGDYLFFLAKGTEKGKQKEKGIVGYGKFEKSYTMKFPVMWNKYKTMNGYPTKERLKEAIQKVTKDHKVPELLNCLELSGVTFFQYPIYLSELGIQISNRIESYIYLDKEGTAISTKILEKADTFGIDLWYSMLQTEQDNQILLDAQLSTIHSIYDRMKDTEQKPSELKKNMMLANEYQKSHSNCIKIAGSKTEFVEIVNGVPNIIIPCWIQTKELNSKIQYLIGHYQLYQMYLKQEGFEIIQVKLAFQQEPFDEWKEIAKQFQIQYFILEKADAS